MRIIGMIKENDSARYMAHCGESLYEFSFIYLYSAKFSLDFCSKCAALIFWDWGIAEKTFIIRYANARTTDAQKGNILHCTANNSLTLPIFLVWPKHILSARSAQFFRYLWFMPALGVYSPCANATAKKFWIHWNRKMTVWTCHTLCTFAKKNALMISYL